MTTSIGDTVVGPPPIVGTPAAPITAPRREAPKGVAMLAYRTRRALSSPRIYLMMLGILIYLFVYWLLCEGLALPRFEKLPGPVVVLKDWLSHDPLQGTSLFTPDYYTHILVSCRRIAIAFVLATVLGVPLGLFMGWLKVFKDYTFPVFELLRPIPIMAWVPIAILMFSGYETPVIFLATLASFFATALNTMLGVQSIDESYFRAAGCLGARRWDVFRHVVVPGALPYIFTGLQISIGVAWFSLVAAEMVSGDWGLGYLILSSYVNSVTIPMVIGMLTLGFVGWSSSALVRWAGDRMMQWQVRALAMQGR